MSKRGAEVFSLMDSGEAEVRNLIRGAGARPVPPSEHLAKIRDTAEEQWRELVKKERERSRFRRKNTMMALAASVLLAVALGWWLMPEWGSVTPDLVASVELVRGDVHFDGSKVARGSELSSGGVIQTAPEDSGTALRLAGGQSMRLDRDTLLRFKSESSFELVRGAVYVDSNAVGSGVEISTGYGMVRDIGTQFQVRLGDREGDDSPLQVRVREGEVVLEQAGLEDLSAKAGEKLTLLRAGLVERGAVKRHGPAWDWIAPVTPPMDIEGASVSEYLEWVSRETGRELRYSDESVAEAARTGTLGGNIEGHTPEESLSILPSSGLGHRTENGLLLVESP